MKKTNTKTKSPAPATSSTTKSAPKKATTEIKGKATPAAVPLNLAPAASPVPPALAGKASTAAPTIKSVVAETPTPVAPVVKAVAPAKVQTKIVARIDVGFGNALFIRGEGPGLSWNQGVPMECVTNDQWEITLGESARPISFKVLVNDTTWCTGADNVVASGSTTTITPEFA